MRLSEHKVISRWISGKQDIRFFPCSFEFALADAAYFILNDTHSGRIITQMAT
jgi:hypothetical protein